jgi:hypothetical protein
MSEQTPIERSEVLKSFSWHLMFLFFGILLLFTKYEWMNILGIIFILVSFTAFYGRIKRGWQSARQGAQQRAWDRAFAKLPNAEEMAEFNIKHFFSCAVYAWIVLKDDAAYQAALTAGKVFSHADRKKALDNLEGMATGFIEQAKEAKEAGNDEEKDNLLSASMKIINLHKVLSEKEWTTLDISKDKLKLDKIDHEYLEALNNFDSTVFEERYPDENFERLITQ